MPPPNGNGKWILGDMFDRDYGHAGNIKILWETRWKAAAQRSVYPFHDGDGADFVDIFENDIIPRGINDPFSDEYTEIFHKYGRRLILEADSSLQNSADVGTARKLYRRANAVLRIGRFPYIDTEAKRKVFELQKATYLRAARLWEEPVEEVIIEHTYAANGDESSIPLYVRKPKPSSPSSAPATNGTPTTAEKFPVILLITGLDGHRPDNTERTTTHLAHGWATLILDIPGTPDCPANRRDPLAPDRLFSSVLDYISSTPDLDPQRIIAWGLSAGGYYAIRLAFTHKDRILAAVGHGAGTHYYIGEEWLRGVGRHEYPFGLERAYVGKYGYKNFEDMLGKCQGEFSLVSGKGKGVAVLAGEEDCARLLLVNGKLDGCMPVEDSLLVRDGGEVIVQGEEGIGDGKERVVKLRRRKNVDVEVVEGRLHMGYPEANGIVFPWMERVMNSV